MRCNVTYWIALALLGALNSGAADGTAQRAALLRRAEQKMKQGDAIGAMTLLQDQMPNGGDDAFLLYNYGITAYAAEKWAIAEAAWDKVALLNEPSLRNAIFFQRGNVLFRQAFDLPFSQKNWGKNITLYRRATESYLKIQPQTDAVQKNIAATTARLCAVYLARGTLHLGKALDEKAGLKSAQKMQAWKVNDALDRLLQETGKAQVDFQDLETLSPNHTKVAEGQTAINQLFEYGFLAKAHALRREADEAGSTQNEVWTVQKYQESITYYDQVLLANPTNAVAKQGALAVRTSLKNLYISEAEIEREQSASILKKRDREKKLAKEIDRLKTKSGAEALTQLAEAEASLRSLQSRYPLSDPEQAIQCLENATEDYQTALSFLPNDPTAKTKREGVFDEIFQLRKTLAEQYLQEAQALPFENDEDADKVVKTQELAVKHLKRAQTMKPSEALAVQRREVEAKKALAQSYTQRAELYTTLGREKKALHLDRAVAYFEKAGQDYVFALRADPLLTDIVAPQKAVQTQLTAMRLELSRNVAAAYEQEALEESDEEITFEIDSDYLRELTLQNDSDKKAPSRTYKTIERPEPVFNW